MIMTRKKSFAGILALGAALALMLGSPVTARADYYGFAEQTISNLVFTGATVGTVATGSQSNASQVGVPNGSESNVAVLDALQSFVGPTARPAENTYTPVGPVNPDYVRGDSQITGAGTLNAVAEGFKRALGTSAGSGSVSLSAPIVVSTTGVVTLTFNYANLVSVFQTNNGGSVAAGVSFDFNIQNSAGVSVFDSAPGVLNNSLSLTSPGSATTPGSGTISISTTLAAGTYQATLIQGARVFINAVPEPSSVALLGVGGLSAFLLVRRTRRLHQLASL
jgi:hypothetical protein